MNFYSIILTGYIIAALLVVYFIARDRRRPQVFFNRHRGAGLVVILALLFGATAAFDARFVEPNIILAKNTTIRSEKIAAPLKIVFIADPQLGNHKKTDWMKKIAARVEAIKPDLALLGGDLIDNEYTFEDESVYLEPLKDIAGKYPIYAVPGNHEYGLGTNTRHDPRRGTGDRSALVEARLRALNIPLLKNQLACPDIKGQKICVFGIDDIWGGRPDFSGLSEWDEKSFLIFLTHNPDGVLLWPDKIKKPDLALAGHSHGGQAYLPGLGPIGDAGIELGKRYYRGLNFWEGILLFTTVGIGESGGPFRFLTPPEIAVIKLDK